MSIKVLVNSTPGTRVSINSEDKSSVRSVGIRPETPATYLVGLKDVNVANVANGQALVYDANTAKWLPQTPRSRLSLLQDVDVANVTNKQTIVYNSTDQKWYPGLTFTFSSGLLPHDNPNYGDIWFNQDESRIYMWVNDGLSEFWLDFLPPVF